MAKIAKFEDIESWRRARTFTNDVYKITGAGKFARDFGLKDQIRRAAISILSSRKDSNAVATTNSFSFFQSQRDRAARRALSFTSRLISRTSRSSNLNL